MSSDHLIHARFFALPGHLRAMQVLIHLPDALKDHWLAQGEALAGLADLNISFPRDPLAVALETAVMVTEPQPEPQQLAAPGKVGRPRKQTREEQIVALRLQQKDATDIAIELNMDAAEVSAILNEARKKTGLKFRRVTKDRKGVYPFHLDLKFVPVGARPKHERMALKYGMSLEQLFEARRTFVEMRRANKSMDDIMIATGIPEKQLWSWLHMARQSGFPDLPLDVGFTDTDVRPVLPIRPKGAPVRLESHASMVARGVHGGAVYKVSAAAQRRGMSIPEYEHLREIVLDMAMAGTKQVQIAEVVGESTNWVSGILTYAFRHGVQIPQSVFNTAKLARPSIAPAALAELSLADAAIAKLPVYDQLHYPQQVAIDRAAEARGLTPQQYIDRRNEAIRTRIEAPDWTYSQIAARCDVSAQTIRDWCRQAMSVGVVFSPSAIPQAETLAAE